MGVRLTAFLWWFLFGEMQALVGLLWIWLRGGGPFGGDSERRRVSLYNLRVHWVRHHLGGIRRLFGLRFEIDGLEHAGPGPILLMHPPREHHRQHARPTPSSRTSTGSACAT